MKGREVAKEEGQRCLANVCDKIKNERKPIIDVRATLERLDCSPGA